MTSVVLQLHCTITRKNLKSLKASKHNIAIKLEGKLSELQDQHMQPWTGHKTIYVRVETKSEVKYHTHGTRGFLCYQ